MIDTVRTFLYFPLGLLPSLFFTLRLLIQWFQSERAKQSVVTPLFWYLSLIGQWLLFLHFVIQVQYPFALIQATNGILSWRNLKLMSRKTTVSFRGMLWILLGTVFFVTLIFLAQSYFLIGELDWIRTPTKPEETRVYHSLVWHIIGTCGGILFAGRFWVQWWQAEKGGGDHLAAPFWWMSLFGSVILIVYFSRTGDTINLLNYSFGMIPYARNLMLLRGNSSPKLPQH